MPTLRDKLGKPIMWHWVGWHGKDGKASIPGYDSRDPNVISHQLSAMRALGGDGCGVIALTYGPTVSPFIHQAVMAMGNQCNAWGMPFALCFDPWTVKNAPDKLGAMISAVTHPDIQFLLNMDCYLSSKTPIGKIVLDFSTGVNQSAIQSALPSIQYWLEQVNYDWVQIPEKANKTPFPCVYSQFNDGTVYDRNKSVWDQTKPVRIVPSLGGKTFWNRDISMAKDYVQFCTWNDYSEGSEIEPFASMLEGKI